MSKLSNQSKLSQKNQQKSYYKPEIDLRVHIAFVGHDLVDRILLPIKEMRADRVYLLVKSDPNMFEENLRIIKKRLIEDYNVSESEIKIVDCDIFDFTLLSQAIAQIIGIERANNNRLYYNISSGGTLNAAVGLLMCMLFKITPYFIKKDYKAITIPQPLDFIPIPEYNVAQPDKSKIRLLSKMKQLMSKFDRDYLYKKEILHILPDIDKAIKKQEIHRNPSDSRLYNLLNNKYLSKMEANGYITFEKKRNGKVRCTQKGIYTEKIFSAYYSQF